MGVKIEKNKMAGAHSAYGVLVGKPEGKTPLRKPMRRWEDIKKWDVEVWTGSSWLTGTGGGHL